MLAFLTFLVVGLCSGCGGGGSGGGSTSTGGSATSTGDANTGGSGANMDDTTNTGDGMPSTGDNMVSNTCPSTAPVSGDLHLPMECKLSRQHTTLSGEWIPALHKPERNDTQ